MSNVVKLPVERPSSGMTAAELLEKVRESGGRAYRMQQPPLVFVITEKQALAEKLISLGAHAFRPQYMATFDYGPSGGYRRCRGGILNWDIYIHTIPVDGDETIWDAVGPPDLTVGQAQHVSVEGP